MSAMMAGATRFSDIGDAVAPISDALLSDGSSNWRPRGSSAGRDTVHAGADQGPPHGRGPGLSSA